MLFTIKVCRILSFLMLLIIALLYNSEIRFLMIGLCFHITNFESIFHRLELNVACNYEKIELCNKAVNYKILFVDQHNKEIFKSTESKKKHL